MLVVLVLPICGLAVLPPAGFALCVDADGHLVVEAETPGSARCCIGPDAAADEACAPASCAECIDIVIAPGDAPAAKQSRDGDVAPLAPAPALLPSGVTCPVVMPRVIGPGTSRPAAPPLRTTSLRL